MPDVSRKITVSVEVPVNRAEAWHAFTDPGSITKWNFASDDWHCPSASVDLQVGGRYSARMDARDGSMGFDFAGCYSEVKHPEALTLILDDGRELRTTFYEIGEGTRVTTQFDPDSEAPVDMQQKGWQAILNNYRTLVSNSLD